MRKDKLNNQHPDEQVSTELQMILSNPPSFLIRYGTLLICLIVALMASTAFFISYPDSIPGDAVLKSEVKINALNLKKNVKLTAVIQVPISVIDRIKPGQEVRLKITDKDDTKYSYPVGIISSISLVNSDKNITVFANIQNDISTNTLFAKNVFGETKINVEIITENKRLIERIFDPIIKSYQK